MRDEKLVAIKYFRKNDEPTQSALSEKEIYDMKDRLIHEAVQASYGGSAPHLQAGAAGSSGMRAQQVSF